MELDSILQIKKSIQSELSKIEMEISDLLAQKKNIESRLTKLNIEGLKLQGKQELIIQLEDDNGQSKS